MKYFGTDGIRAKAEKFDKTFLTAIVRGLVNYAGNEIKVLLGGDTRESSEWILADLEAALESFGIEYGSVEVLPTPAIDYCYEEMGFDFAIDVTASHNPYTDNGIKIFEIVNWQSQKLGEAGCQAIEDAIEAALAEKSESEATDGEQAAVAPSLRESLHQEALELYTTKLKNYLGQVSFSGLKIGMDCANGATSVINHSVFEELGAQVVLINAEAKYGQKINHNCGSTHLEPLQELVRSRKLDFGVAFDGDGDRCLLVDGQGELVDGDQIIVILAEFLKLKGVAATVMANQGLMSWAKAHEVALEITAVGDSNVAAAMREKQIPIGGEQSGHIILPGEATGDGMLTALMVTKAVAETGRSLAELAGAMQKFPQAMVNLEANAAQKQALKEKPEAKQVLLDYHQRLEERGGRLLVRPSGTEELIRITVWGEDEAEIQQLAEELKEKLGEVLT